MRPSMDVAEAEYRAFRARVELRPRRPVGLQTRPSEPGGTSRTSLLQQFLGSRAGALGELNAPGSQTLP